MTGIRRDAIEPPMASSVTALALRLDVAEVELLVRGAVPQMRAVGGHTARLGELLDEWLATRPDERRKRRNAAIVVLAGFCEPGSFRHVAKQIRTKGSRFEATRWRRERMLAAAPLVHGAEGAALFALMRACGDGGTPGDRTIREALAEFRRGQNNALSVAHGTDQAVVATNEQRSRHLNAMKDSEFEALAALARQPTTQKILADDRARIVAERKARLDSIHALDAEAETAWPAGQAAIKAAAAKVRAAEVELRYANDALAKAHAEAAAASHTHTIARQGAERALIDGADSATIAAWRSELLDELDRLRRSGILIYSETIERHQVTRKQRKRGVTNAASVAARMKAVLDSRCEDLALEPDQSRLPAIIAEIRASWPPLEEKTFDVEIGVE